MTCPHCEGANDFFGKRIAEGELKDYRKKGPAKTTRWLLDILKSKGVSDMTLLDIGGGVGAIQHELVNAGVQHTTDIDASSAYLNAARIEAERLGYHDRAAYYHGDFVELAEQIDAADIVTLDRVICCYPDANALVKLSSERARRFYAVIYPVDKWWYKLGIPVFNFLLFKLRGSPFRTYIHPTKMINALIQESGFKPIFRRTSFMWQVVIYERTG